MLNKLLPITEKAGKIAMSYFNTEYNIQTKSSLPGDIVTEADIAVDNFIRTELLRMFPTSQVLTEEYKNKPTAFSGDLWIVDPIDGTQWFAEGKKTFSVLIGLCRDGVPILSAVYLPAQQKLLYAEKGKGAFLKQGTTTTKITASMITELPTARILVRPETSTPRPFDQFLHTLPGERVVREPFGANASMIATNEAELYLYSGIHLHKWDTCAPQLLVEEAGGKLTDVQGNLLDYQQKETMWGKPVLITNGHLHPVVLTQAKAWEANHKL